MERDNPAFPHLARLLSANRILPLRKHPNQARQLDRIMLPNLVLQHCLVAATSIIQWHNECLFFPFPPVIAHWPQLADSITPRGDFPGASKPCLRLPLVPLRPRVYSSLNGSFRCTPRASSSPCSSILGLSHPDSITRTIRVHV